mmetsp:Transcript_30184/g.58272  ORF Transcript_30184/g.58272 Transcript_30184/m.58272 type:complete len:106 (-) Transcript_30184:112-429(-)
MGARKIEQHDGQGCESQFKAAGRQQSCLGSSIKPGCTSAMSPCSARILVTTPAGNIQSKVSLAAQARRDSCWTNTTAKPEGCFPPAVAALIGPSGEPQMRDRWAK